MKMIKGETIEEQMKHVDILLNRMSKRLHKTVMGIITPFPISGYAKDPIDKVVLRYMFPSDGTITVGGLYIESVPKEGIEVYVNIHRGDTVDSRSIFTKKQYVIISPDAEILAGDRLVISIDSKGEESVFGVWISFLWVPSIKGSEIKKYLIEDLERIGEENAEGE